MADEGNRVRAWVLVRTENAEAISDALTRLLTQGGEDYVVVRADVVDGEMNLVVPVDAASQTAFDNVKGMIQEAAGEAEISVATVTKHNPIPPHSAHGFITPGELDKDRDPAFEEPGRQGSSPGRNPWG